jgi:hypothetical protein
MKSVAMVQGSLEFVNGSLAWYAWLGVHMQLSKFWWGTRATL